jgi:hypothetical protein
MKVGVIGGGFKPPHKGHFDLAKKALQQVPDLDKLQIYVGASPSGTKDRPGFPMTQEQAIAIWKVYVKQLPGTVEVLPAAQPIGAAYSAASKNPDNEVYWFLGARDQADMKDIEQRKSHLGKNAEKYPNLHVEVIDSTGTGVSGTALRKALDNNDKETAFKMLPDGVDKQAVYDIIMNTPEKKMADAIDEVFANLMYTQEDIEWLNAPMGPIEEVTKGSPVAPVAVLPSKDRQELQNYTEILRDALPDTLDVEYRGDHIRVSIPYFDKEKNHKFDGTPDQRLLPEETVGQFEFAPHIASILEYCMEQGMKVLPLPDIKIRHDEENAADLFGKTAYYQPQTQEIVLYVTGRHPKDVLRSFCHELIHHQQNLEGRIPAFNTTNTQEDSTLHQIEQEAHMGGSMLFREWEDTCKKRDLEEGTKYRSIVVDIRKAVNAALNTLLSGSKLKGYNIETKREPSKEDRELAEKYGMTPLGVMFHNEYQTAYLGTFESKSEKGTPTKVGVSLKFALTDEVKPGKYHIDGEAGSDEGEIDIILAFNPKDGTNMLQAIQPQLTDLIRHETEHLTQSGDQVKPTKWMRADQAKRREIRQNPEIWHKYYLLPKEVDANIQGLYAKAKYEKKDFQDVVDTYLTDLVGDGIITQGDSKQIYSKWKTRATQIGGIPELK